MDSTKPEVIAPVIQFPADAVVQQAADLLNNLFKAGLIVYTGNPTHGTYASQEYDNGNATGTATINWANGNVQYLTLTGNTTLTFTNPLPGMRCILHVAGAFTPTFPATVRFTAGTTPTATATSGHKDIYTFIYSGKEALYDALQSPNYAIT